MSLSVNGTFMIMGMCIKSEVMHHRMVAVVSSIIAVTAMVSMISSNVMAMAIRNIKSTSLNLIRIGMVAITSTMRSINMTTLAGVIGGMDCSTIPESSCFIGSTGSMSMLSILSRIISGKTR